MNTFYLNNTEIRKNYKNRAVIFDLFGTLVPSCSIDNLRQSLCQMAHCLKVDEELFVQKWKYDKWFELVKGDYPTLELALKSICIEFNVIASSHQIATAIELRLNFTRSLLHVSSKTQATLRELKDSGWKIALITNCAPDVPMVWKEMPIASLMDVTVFSCETGFCKPDRKIYDVATKLLKVDRTACIFIGDGNNRELSGAKKAGMRAILIAHNKKKAISIEKEDNEASLWDGERIERIEEIIYKI